MKKSRNFIKIFTERVGSVGVGVWKGRECVGIVREMGLNEVQIWVFFPGFF